MEYNYDNLIKMIQDMSELHIRLNKATEENSKAEVKTLSLELNNMGNNITKSMKENPNFCFNTNMYYKQRRQTHEKAYCKYCDKTYSNIERHFESIIHEVNLKKYQDNELSGVQAEVEDETTSETN